ncbi:Gfo/Idh/MocA family protein [Bifidobacterium avesanii]|uniref:Gfo/Idh/MocA family oxidoreductase n=1 Tax=Bifidobacterium avesanii TaxID=1798157 RepID=A0A7K3TIG3_9BIFI|nr:Gfo/Idh/MocA family oxidoreductase [Bifidobacterium avesanii]KAB8292860.1 oxidoreductase [Bifidobacterium avesanii]NEG78464.1 gfo/Idh/MocA family oxidoreductase [Bifidobacterium avesanii]
MPNTSHSQVNVAILGAGRIAHAMADTLVKMAADPRYADLVAPYAVAARDGDRARAFADQYGFPVSHGSYEELVADPNVDLVYIATPHSLHAEQAKLCIGAGKATLVEKSFTANEAQAREVLAEAERAGVLCTEAIWTRYMPSRAMIDEIVDAGLIGELRSVSADLSYVTTGKARMTDPALAGGALLDVGVYPLNFIDMVLRGREPERIVTSCALYPTGVDEQNATTLYYAGNVMASATSSMSCVGDRFGVIRGTEGYVVCENINNVRRVVVFGRDHKPIVSREVPEQLTGYEYEVAAAAHALVDGRTECAEMPHADTLRIMAFMDRIRADWGLRFPFE